MTPPENSPEKPIRIARHPDDSFENLHGRGAGSWRVDDPAAHGQAVRGMFSRIAGVYDRMNRLLSFNRDRRWRRELVGRLDNDAWEILDLCAGTCDLALQCAEAGKGRLLVGLDFCPEMLAIGRRKSRSEKLILAAADAQELPLPSLSVDAVVVGFGLRNLADVRKGLREMGRVLRPGGQLLVLDFFRAVPAATGQERGPSRPVRWVVDRLVPAAGRLLARDGPAYSYLPHSRDQFLTVDELAALLPTFGFTDVFARRQTLGIAHLVGARRGFDPDRAASGHPSGQMEKGLLAGEGGGSDLVNNSPQDPQIPCR